MQNMMKFKLGSILVGAIFSCNLIIAQDVQEAVQELSKKAVKGYLYDVNKEANGNINVFYKMKLDKKSDEVQYEEYSFDKNLKLLEDKDISMPKESHEDYEQTVYFTTVGGCTSFDILSMKLKLNKTVRLRTWSHEKQKYITKKTISRETIKARNDDGKVYYGYASYLPSDEKNTKVFTLAKVESKEKGQADKFVLVFFDVRLMIEEKPVELNGAYTLVYSDQLKNDDVVLVFAPKKGASDYSKYIYFQYSISGELKNKVEFNSPAPAMIITSSFDQDGNVYLCGSSVKSKGPYDSEFDEYAPIENPCFKDGNNKLDMRWQKSSKQKMDNFHILKFTGNQLVFASNVPISEFKSKFKTSPKDKGADPYKGKKFYIERFYVSPNEDFIIAGQLSSTVSMGIGNPVKSYEDIVCFQFDKTGSLKAQYGVERTNTDKKSEIFPLKQNFYPAADGGLYWEILEVKGDKGYESFFDAYYGNPTFYAKYFPRVGKINLSNTSVSECKVLGDQKYFLNKHFVGFYDSKEKVLNYIGHDSKFKKLWLAKVVIP